MMRTIFWAAVLLGLVFCVVSLVAVDLVRPVVKELAQQGKLQHCDRCERAFDSTSEAMVTFYTTMLMGDSIADLFVPILENDPLACIFLLAATASIFLGFNN